jgi:uncharacterized protein (TIGR02996 family)
MRSKKPGGVEGVLLQAIVDAVTHQAAQAETLILADWLEEQGRNAEAMFWRAEVKTPYFPAKKPFYRIGGERLAVLELNLPRTYPWFWLRTKVGCDPMSHLLPPNLFDRLGAGSYRSCSYDGNLAQPYFSRRAYRTATHALLDLRDAWLSLHAPLV